MALNLLRESDRERWDRYVLDSGMSNCYHLTGWKEVIEKSFGHKTYYLFSENKDFQINGILPLTHLNSRLFGSFIISLPYFNYGGICADNDEIQNILLERSKIIATELNADHIELRQSQKFNSSLPVKSSKVSMLLDLSSTTDDLWKSFPSKLRSQINRPQKDGLYAVIGREEEINSFYKVFSINMRDLGTPVYPKEFFKNILKQFPESTSICTVYSKNKEPIASGFLVGFKDRMEIPWASSLRSFNRYSPNMLLYWSVLKTACEKGFRYFDFGRSTPNEGTYKFKEQWGAKPFPLNWYYWMRNGNQLPELNPRNPKYKMAINIWKRFPVGLTRIIGPMIVRNLP